MSSQSHDAKPESIELSPEALKSLRLFRKQFSGVVQSIEEFTRKFKKSLWPGNESAAWPNSIESQFEKSIVDLDQETWNHFCKVLEEKGIESLQDHEQLLTEQIHEAKREIEAESNNDLHNELPFQTIRLIFQIRLNALKRLIRTYLISLEIPEYDQAVHIHLSDRGKVKDAINTTVLGGYRGDQYLKEIAGFIKRYPGISSFKEFHKILDSEEGNYPGYGRAVVKTLGERIERIYGKPAWERGYSGFRTKILQLHDLFHDSTVLHD